MWWYMNARVAGIKFKPKKKRNQTVELAKWLDSKSNWVTPSLTEFTKFIGFFFENFFIAKEVS